MIISLTKLDHIIENISGGYVINKRDTPKNLFFIDLEKEVIEKYLT